MHHLKKNKIIPVIEAEGLFWNFSTQKQISD